MPLKSRSVQDLEMDISASSVIAIEQAKIVLEVAAKGILTRSTSLLTGVALSRDCRSVHPSLELLR
jgi:hypothetical protein